MGDIQRAKRALLVVLACWALWLVALFVTGHDSDAVLRHPGNLGFGAVAIIASIHYFRLLQFFPYTWHSHMAHVDRQEHSLEPPTNTSSLA